MKSKRILPVVLLAGLLFCDAGLHAQIFVSNIDTITIGGSNADIIGEYNLDGSPVGSGTLALAWGGEAFGIALSGSNILVSNETGGTNNYGSISEFTMAGTPVGAGPLVSSSLGQPMNIVVIGSNIFATCFNKGTILEYTMSGAPVGSGTFLSKLGSPSGMAVSGSDIFITTETSILEYTTSGAPVGTGTLVTPSSGDLRGIVVSGSDIFAVSVYGRILEYTTSGAPVGTGTLVSGINTTPIGIAISGSDLYVTAESGNSILEYTTSGAPVGTGKLISNDTHGPAGIVVVAPPSAPAYVTPTSQTTPVSSGSLYANEIAPITGIGGYSTKAAIVGGTASASSSVTMAFNGSGSFSNIASDVLTVSGMPNKGTTPAGATLTDQYVLELSYDNNAANQLGGANALEILWLNPNTDQWVNAILGNSDQGAGASTETQSEMLAAYNPSTDDNLSWYGVDATDGYIWAVLDHNSSLGVGNSNIEPIPEPSTWVLLGMGGACFIFAARRRGNRTFSRNHPSVTPILPGR